jgi:hypothetical protein
MDPALIAFDLAKAGAIVADMVVSFLAAGGLSANAEEPDDSPPQDCRPAPLEAGVHLYPAIDAGSGALQPGEHGPAVQPGQQGVVAGVGSGEDPGPRPRSRPVRSRRQRPDRLQDLGQRRGDGPDRRDLVAGGVTTCAIEPGLAPPARAVRDHRYPRHRRGWRVPSRRIQRRLGSRDEGHVRPGGAAHHPRAPPRR